MKKMMLPTKAMVEILTILVVKQMYVSLRHLLELSSAGCTQSHVKTCLFITKNFILDSNVHSIRYRNSITKFIQIRTDNIESITI